MSNNPQQNDPVDILNLMLQNNLIDGAKMHIAAFKLPYKIEIRDDKPVLLNTTPGCETWLNKFISIDSDTVALKDDARKLSMIDDEVLILGETGTGKELIARAMIGDRDAKFCRINCAAMPKELIESELFGHKKGSFTGAMTDKKGMMEVAKGGVLFLDEVGDLPLEIQAKLLNALQPIDGKRYIRPVGGTEEVEISCRIVCATHRNLMEMVNDKLFRLDLYARISTFVLKIKPLRERRCDIPDIMQEIGKILHREKDVTELLNGSFRDMIMSSEFKLELNVRSLEQIIKRYSVLKKI